MNIAVDTLKASTRGAHWFKALTQGFKTVEGFPASIWVADGQIDQQVVRVIAVVQDSNNLFPRAKTRRSWIIRRLEFGKSSR